MVISTLLSARSMITREKFEELCGNLWEEALVPVKELLRHSGLKVDDIYAVELIGGATRVPKLQVFFLCIYLDYKLTNLIFCSNCMRFLDLIVGGKF